MGKLHTAAENGDLKTCAAILENDTMLINQERDDGWTPLHCAVFSENAEIVRFLLQKNANPNIKSSCDISIIELASKSWAIKTLLEGKDPFQMKSPYFQIYRKKGARAVVNKLNKLKLEYKQHIVSTEIFYQQKKRKKRKFNFL